MPRRIVNWHSHLYPPEEISSPVWQIFSLDNLLETNDRSGVDLIVVTNPFHYVKGRSMNACLDAVKRWTDYAAEIQARYPRKLQVFASTISTGGAAFVKELERAVREYGMRACFANSSHDGRYPEEDDALPALRSVRFFLSPSVRSVLRLRLLFGSVPCRRKSLLGGGRSIGCPGDDPCAALQLRRRTHDDVPTDLRHRPANGRMSGHRPAYRARPVRARSGPSSWSERTAVAASAK